MPAPKKKYYTAKEIAEILDVKMTKAYDILHACEFRGIVYRDGGTIRVDINGFNEYIAEHTNAPGKYEDRLDALVSEGRAAAVRACGDRRRVRA